MVSLKQIFQSKEQNNGQQLGAGQQAAGVDLSTPSIKSERFAFPNK